MRSFLLLAFVAFFAPLHAQAQVVQVEFKDEKAQKRYKKNLSLVNGQLVLLGEPVLDGGIWIEEKEGGSVIHYKGGGDNELFLLDFKDPSKVPYKYSKDRKVPLKRSSVLSVDGKHIGKLSLFQANQTIESLAREYSLRLGRIEALEDVRRELRKGSSPWFVAHRRVLGGYERLISWLEQCTFTEAAKSLRKTYLKQKKLVAKEAITLRAEAARKSVKRLGTTPALKEALAKIQDDSHEFRVQESQHLRLIYTTRYEEDRISDLLRLGESVIEVFRNQFVDAYVSDEFQDRLPEGIFQEFYFGPHDPDFHEKFVTAYYGNVWGDYARKKRFLQTTGSRFTGEGNTCLDVWRVPEHEDLEGVLTHSLGHSLADFHFNGGPEGMQQPWMEEGLGYYLSFELLGRNSVTCMAFDPGKYVRPARKEGDKAMGMSYRDALNGMALEQGPRIDRLMLKRLAEMENADLAKSWSFFEYVASTLDVSGQRWLRECCGLARDRSTFIARMRAFTEQLYGESEAAEDQPTYQAGGDVFKFLDNRWRAYAESDQISDR